MRDLVASVRSVLLWTVLTASTVGPGTVAMCSKAGARITNRVPGIAGIYKQSAAGNYLYRQRANHSFELVSGDNPPALAIAKAGWSWGGQFADFDNDGFLDLYALSGYFTAPEAVSSELDL